MPKFDLSKLSADVKVIERSQYDYDEWNGRLLCWEEPKPHEYYALGVDPAEGVRGDRSVCQVIKIGNMHHPDVQVAEFTCDFMDPVDFAYVVKTIGADIYPDPDNTEAFCTVECNAPCGDTMISDLRMKLDYGNLYVRKAYDRINNIYTNSLGWWTNKASRPKIIARGLHALSYGDLIINSPYLIDEMSDFKQDQFEDSPRARAGKHDDRVMALLIGYWGAHDEEFLSGEDIGEQRRLAARVKKVEEIKQELAPERRASYQAKAMSSAEMSARANADFAEWFED